ncbi:hypothetical protein SNEBB_007116 [Seison nebaliae]|nr:hypothetical protein SNEBB_007116 [Seison nebaliae]
MSSYRLTTNVTPDSVLESMIIDSSSPYVSCGRRMFCYKDGTSKCKTGRAENECYCKLNYGGYDCSILKFQNTLPISLSKT